MHAPLTAFITAGHIHCLFVLPLFHLHDVTFSIVLTFCYFSCHFYLWLSCRLNFCPFTDSWRATHPSVWLSFFSVKWPHQWWSLIEAGDDKDNWESWVWLVTIYLWWFTTWLNQMWPAGTSNTTRSCLVSTFRKSFRWTMSQPDLLRSGR